MPADPPINSLISMSNISLGFLAWTLIG